MRPPSPTSRSGAGVPPTEGSSPTPSLTACRWNGGPPAGAGEVYAIYIEPTALRRGHGRRLLAHAMADLAARGFDPIVVWVLDANVSARRFYEAAGLRADGSRATIDFDGAPVDEVRYRMDMVARPSQRAATAIGGDLPLE